MIISNVNAGTKQLVYLSTVPGWTGNTTILVRKRDNDRPVYVIDAWRLQTNRKLNSNRVWMPMWLSEYKDNPGDNIYDVLETGLPISKISQSTVTNQIYKTDFKFAPLIPESNNPENILAILPGVMPYETAPPTWEAEYALYYMAVYPSYPLLVTNTIPINNKYCGPLFLKSMNLSCNDNGKSNISVSLEGSKYFIYDKSTVESNDYEYGDLFRSANFADCFCLLNTYASLIPSFSNIRVIGMSLNITQNFKYTFPCHTSGTDDKGARFIGLQDRKVTGTVSVLAPDEYTDLSVYQQIIMYFGGPFYFPMYNVKWQKPVTEIKVNDGYVHTCSFVALADPSSVMSSYNTAAGQIVSEFNLTLGATSE